MTDKHIGIITTVHNIKDDRIYHKEVLSLVKYGFKITMIAPCDGIPTDLPVSVIPLTPPQGKIFKRLLNNWLAFKYSLKINADLYHFHDPDFLPFAGLLRLLGKKVVFDAHENYRQNLKFRKLPKWVKSPIYLLWWCMENVVGKIMNYVMVADSYTAKTFPNRRIKLIANYAPLRITEGIEEISQSNAENDNFFKILYIGGISYARGLGKSLEALKFLDENYKLIVAGPIIDEELRIKLEENSKVEYLGFVPWEDIGKIIFPCQVGLILLQPVPAYLYCTGENIVKLFEYMAFGLPVLISHFPPLKQFVGRENCGLAVDPTSPQAIAEAIKYLHDNPEIRTEMGMNGKRAFREKYNWEKEEVKLLEVYREVLGSPNHKSES